jgi:outer membrane immunogenic protein
MGQWVVGAEGHIGSAKNTVSLPGVAPGTLQLISVGYPAGVDDRTSVYTGWDAGIRGRFGRLVTPAFLAYATGGPAWQRVELTASCGSVCPSPVSGFGAGAAPTSATAATTNMGWTAGGGAEVKVAGHWLARGEYTYARFGDIAFDYAYATTSNPPGTSYSTQLSLRTHTFVLGLGYKFGF